MSRLIVFFMFLVFFATLPSAEASKPLHGSRSGVVPKGAPAGGYSEEARFKEHESAMAGGSGRVGLGGGSVSMPGLGDMIEAEEAKNSEETTADQEESDENGPPLPYDLKDLPAFLAELETLHADLIKTREHVAGLRADLGPKSQEIMTENEEWVATSLEHLDEAIHDIGAAIETIKARPANAPVGILGDQVDAWKERRDAAKDEITDAGERETEWREELK